MSTIRAKTRGASDLITKDPGVGRYDVLKEQNLGSAFSLGYYCYVLWICQGSSGRDGSKNRSRVLWFDR